MRNAAQALHRTVELSHEAKLPILLLRPRSDAHLWSRALGSDRKDKVREPRGQNQVPPQGQGEKLRHLEGARSRAAALWPQKEQIDVVRTSDQDASGQRRRDGARTCWRNPGWLGNALRSLRRSWKVLPMGRMDYRFEQI